MAVKLTPAFRTQHKFRQTNEGLEKNNGNGQETCASKKQDYMGHTVQSSEGKIKGHEPVDPFLPKVFDDHKQAKKQHRT